MHDDENFRYITPKGKEIKLTKKENRILKILINNKSKVTSKEEFCKDIYGDKLDCYYNKCICCLITRLRRKLRKEVQIMSRNKIGYFIK